MSKFKDACDKCGKFDYCKGVAGQVLCPACAQEETNGQSSSTNVGTGTPTSE